MDPRLRIAPSSGLFSEVGVVREIGAGNTTDFTHAGDVLFDEKDGSSQGDTFKVRATGAQEKAG